jgi:hypothetical protein
VNPKNERTSELKSHRSLESSIKSLLNIDELNCVENEFSKRETRNRLLGADIATDQTIPVNTSRFSVKLLQRQPHKKSTRNTIRFITNQTQQIQKRNFAKE